MKFAHKLTLALLVVLAVVLSLCNTVLIGQQFRQELHTAQETLSADWQRESRVMQRTLVTPGSGSLAARVGSYLQAITEQNSLACAAYSVDGTSLYYALPTAVPLSEVEALLAQDGEPRMVLANNHTLLCAGTVVLPERCITLVIAQDAAPVWQARQARTRNALIVELLAMVLAGGLVLLLCRRMTRPLEQLEQASRQIAAGAYSQRTAIHGSDEIASLSRSFDEMAQAVEGTVQTLQQNARQKDDFVAAFTHELKTPMTSILGFAAAGELKTKPTQHSVKELQSVGIQPDVLVLRAEHPLSDGLRKKVAQFCNVDDKAVVQSIDAETIYEVPLLMQAQGLDSTILEKMGLPVGETPGLGPWRKFLERRHAAETKEPINIALVGKYDLQDAYKSIREALSQAGTYNDRKVEVHFVNSEKLTDENVAEALKGMAGVMIGPGFGQRGIDGKFVAIKYTRTHDIPTFGICLGMQCIAIEFARNVLGYADADSREMDEKTPHNVIDIMEEQKAITNMGGTMRLGAYECVLQKGSKAYLAYGEEHIQERHRHRYEFNNDYKAQYEAAGMKCVGINPESDLVEIVEIPALKWFIGTQFHPEYSSTVLNPHPLFVAFVKAAIENEKN